jgi:glycosyltransferase involved in cell wall biosynthesis
MNHEVELIALHYNWSHLPRKSFMDSNVAVSYVGQMHVRKEGPRKLYYKPVRFMLVSIASTLRLARAVYRSDADLIQLCKPQPYNVLAARLGNRKRPIYCDCDDYEAETNLFSSKWQKTIVRYFEDGVVNDITGLTVNTHFSQQRYSEMGFPEDRIVYVPNGVERRRFDGAALPSKDWLDRLQMEGIDLESPIIMYVGTLGLHSHPLDLLLKAFQQVIHQVPDAQLVLIGGGEDYDALKQLSGELGIDSRTFFLGRQPPADISHYLSHATVTVDPVYDDLIARARSPLKVLESMVMGIPVVTGDVGDRRQMLKDGKAGVLVQPGSSQALADGISMVLLDHQFRWQLAGEAAADRERWFWDSLVQDFIKIYDL